MNKYNSQTSGLRGHVSKFLSGNTRRDWRNSLFVAMWTLIWAAVFSATLQGIRTGRLDGVVTWVMIAVSTIISIMALRAFVVFVREADEMISKLYFDALAFGFGAGAVFYAFSELLEALGGPVYDRSELFTAMCLAFGGKVVWNVWRNR